MNGEPQETAQARFDRFISVLIATVAVLVAVTATLQVYASGRAQAANRAVQQLSIAATEKRVTGAVQLGYHWQGAFQVYREAELQSVGAGQEGDRAAADLYARLRDQLAAQSPMLQPPYFDSTATDFPNARGFAADLYLIDAERLKEQAAAQAEIGRAWSNIANVFVIQLTLLTVALSLYGLSNTLAGRMRWMFVSLGSGIVLLNLAWAAILLLLPRPAVAPAAIDAYANGVGQAYEGNYAGAIGLFDQALAAKPGYANALYERGGAHLSQGEYQPAAADFAAAIQAGRNDENANRSLAWADYLVGAFDQARAVNQRLLQKQSGSVGVLLSQGLVLLVQGEAEGARAAYDQGVTEAARLVAEARAQGAEPPSSLWLDLDASASALQDLLDSLAGRPHDWTRAPDPGVIGADQAPMVAFATEEIKVIKEARVALEYAGRLPDGAAVIQVEPFQFGLQTYDDQGNPTGFEAMGSFPYGTPGISVTFDYTGLTPGQQVLWKVYRDGVENRSLRDDWNYFDLGEAGSWVKFIGYTYTNVFVMASGEYTVELYVDARLVQQGSFVIEQP
jgi:tetratricopeptide (TPR) repeat protein